LIADERNSATLINLNTRLIFFSVPVLSLMAIPSASLGAPSSGENLKFGSLHGTLISKNVLPVSETQVQVRGQDGQVLMALPVDGSGGFTASALLPGRYGLGVIEGGVEEARLDAVEIVAGEDARADITLPASPSTSVSESALPDATAPAAAPAPIFKPTDGFFIRWGKAYVADWTGATPADPNAPKRRGTPPPISSPPFPAADWPIGGTQEIGAPDYQTYMLQEAIDKDPLKLSKVKWYGWVSIGGNGSTNNRGNASKGIPANLPSAYDEFPNTIVMDQLALYTEKLADTTQTDHFDWGFRLANLYGQDYRFTTSHGLFSQQLLVKNAQYGYDPVMFYVDLYFPKLAKGADLRIGRYISLPDIEAQLAPNNYTYSHSILYTYDCYTQLGANLTAKISDHWTIQAGISPGCDTMPWTTDAQVTGNTCIVYSWHSGGDALNTCANSLNNSKYAYNNLAAYYETWYHKINEHWHTDTEFWYQYMKDTPNMYWYNTGVPNGNVSRSVSPTPWPEHTAAGGILNFGAVCENPALPASAQSARCLANEWAVTNYVEHDFRNHQASLNIRNEVVDDLKGQRTGTPGVYEEHMVGFDFWTGSTVTFRPELSYTHSFSPYGLRALDINPGASVAALSNLSAGETATQAMKAIGAKTQVLTLAADLIWHF
jgi:hypothetical protein